MSLIYTGLIGRGLRSAGRVHRDVELDMVASTLELIARDPNFSLSLPILTGKDEMPIDLAITTRKGLPIRLNSY
jgi:hypothetical protein